MTVNCTKCNYPWEVHHLRTLLDKTKVFMGNPNKQPFKEQFARGGFVFHGKSVYAIKSCPRCDKPISDALASDVVEEMLDEIYNSTPKNKG